MRGHSSVRSGGQRNCLNKGSDNKNKYNTVQTGPDDVTHNTIYQEQS